MWKAQLIVWAKNKFAPSLVVIFHPTMFDLGSLHRKADVFEKKKKSQCLHNVRSCAYIRSLAHDPSVGEVASDACGPRTYPFCLHRPAGSREPCVCVKTSMAAMGIYCTCSPPVWICDTQSIVWPVETLPLMCAFMKHTHFFCRRTAGSREPCIWVFLGHSRAK